MGFKILKSIHVYQYISVFVKDLLLMCNIIPEHLSTISWDFQRITQVQESYCFRMQSGNHNPLKKLDHVSCNTFFSAGFSKMVSRLSNYQWALKYPVHTFSHDQNFLFTTAIASLQVWLLNLIRVTDHSYGQSFFTQITYCNLNTFNHSLESLSWSVARKRWPLHSVSRIHWQLALIMLRRFHPMTILYCKHICDLT